MTARAIANLRRLCQGWGGDLRIVNPEEFDARGGFVDDGWGRPDGYRGFWQSPFTSYHGFDYENGVLYAARGAGHVVETGALIHEMGHVFVDRFLDRSDEWDWFGWEVAVARYAGCYRTWDKQNGNYTVAPHKRGSEWGVLSADRKRSLAAERVDHAMARGFLDGRARPLARFTRPLPTAMRRSVLGKVRHIEASFEAERKHFGEKQRMFWTPFQLETGADL